jgi:glutaredoxin
MRKITLLIAVLIGFAMNAQYHQVEWVTTGENPRLINDDPEQPEGFLNGNGYNWNSVLASGATSWSTSQTIPFSFEFNGNTETSYSVHPSGLVTFSSSPASAPTSLPNIPSSSLPDKTVVMFGLNLGGANDAVVSKTFGTAPYRQHWIMWASASYTTGTHWAYWSIVFEESTNNIYIVDQRTYSASNTNISLVAGVQVNSTTAVSATGSPNLGSINLATAGGGSDQTDNKVFAFPPQTNQADWDGAGQSVNMPAYVQINTATDIDASFVNYGYNNVTSLGVQYKIANGPVQNATISGLNTAPGEIEQFSIPNAFNIPTAGNVKVKVWVNTLNGNGDVNRTNDTVYAEVTVVSALTTRYSLYETFTSSTCPPCTPANQTMEQIFGNNPDEYVSLKYQMSWPGNGDPYYTLEGLTRRQFYGVNSVPNVAIDGGWNDNGNNLTQAVFDQFQAVPAFVNLMADYSISGQTVNIDVEIDPIQNINSTDLRLFVAIKEKKTTQNVKTNGETEFFDVFKKFASSDQGDPIAPLTSGVTVNQSFSYTFNGSYILPPDANSPVDHSTAHTVEEFSDLGVAVWIQDVVTNEVLQAAEGNLINVGIDDFDPVTHNLRVFPNPAHDVAYVSVDMTKDAVANVNVISALGQVVVSKSAQLTSGTSLIDLNTANMASGVYFVKIEIEGASQTVKLTVE